jgi:hypothetical protein
MLVVVLLCDRARPADELYSDFNDPGKQQLAVQAWEGYRDPGVLFWSEPPGPLAVTIDWRILTMFNSHTSQQWGTPPVPGIQQFAPLSKLDFSLDSTWTGFRFGLEEADSAAHFEWLTPMGQGINGNMEDRDWSGPNTDPYSLSSSSERWNEGQMLDIEYEFRLLKRPLGLPVDFWPLAGFRWQRFDMTAYAGNQIISTSGNPPVGPFPPPFDGDGITFNQKYSIGYLGTQLRGRLETRILPPIAWTLQGDWGYTQANNVDHHLLRDQGDWYAMEDTHGDCWHVGLTAEALFCRDRFSIGFQADYTEISTTGSHRWVDSGVTPPADTTWTV